MPVQATGRYAGRPELEIPPPLAAVPQVRTPEPGAEPVHFPLDLTPFLPRAALRRRARAARTGVAPARCCAACRATTATGGSLAPPVEPLAPGEAEVEIPIAEPRRPRRARRRSSQSAGAPRSTTGSWCTWPATTPTATGCSRRPPTSRGRPGRSPRRCRRRPDRWVYRVRGVGRRPAMCRPGRRRPGRRARAVAAGRRAAAASCRVSPATRRTTLRVRVARRRRRSRHLLLFRAPSAGIGPVEVRRGHPGAEPSRPAARRAACGSARPTATLLTPTADRARRPAVRSTPMAPRRQLPCPAGPASGPGSGWPRSPHDGIPSPLAGPYTFVASGGGVADGHVRPRSCRPPACARSAARRHPVAARARRAARRPDRAARRRPLRRAPIVVWLPLAASGGADVPAALPGHRHVPPRRAPDCPGCPGVTTLLELSPLPFAIRRRVPPAAGDCRHSTSARSPPTRSRRTTKWSLPARTDRRPRAAAFVGAGVRRPGRAVAGGVDRADRADAMTASKRRPTSPRGASSTAFAGTDRVLRVLDHVGRPARRAAIQRDAARTARRPSPPTRPATLPLPAGDVSAALAGRPRPVHALYERGTRRRGRPRDQHTARRARSAIPAALTGGHLQLLDAARWFAARPAAARPRPRPRASRQPAASRSSTASTRSALMLDDLRAATGAGCGAHFAGLGVQRLPARPRRPRAARCSPISSAATVPAAATTAPARFLMDKYLVFRARRADRRHRAAGRAAARSPASTCCSCSRCSTCSTSTTAAVSALGGARPARRHCRSRRSASSPLLEKLEDKIDGSKELRRGAQRDHPGHRAACPAPRPLRRQPARPVVATRCPFDPVGLHRRVSAASTRSSRSCGARRTRSATG